MRCISSPRAKCSSDCVVAAHVHPSCLLGRRMAIFRSLLNLCSALQAEREARMERDARRAAGLPAVEPGAGDEDDDSDSEEILDLVPEVLLLGHSRPLS